jgi:hypothetical protein
MKSKKEVHGLVGVGAMEPCWTLGLWSLEPWSSSVKIIFTGAVCTPYADRESQLARGAAEQPMKDPCAGEAVLGPEFHER